MSEDGVNQTDREAFEEIEGTDELGASGGSGAPDEPAAAERASHGADPPDDEGVGPSAERPSERAEEGPGESRLRADYEELNDRHLRLAAEFTNFRRRVESEAMGTWSRAQADLVGRFLEVLDDLQRVAALDPDDEKVTVQSIVEGVDLVEQKFVRVLEDVGVETIAPGVGEPFDPEQMEAMMRVPTDDSSLEDAVAQLFQKGYAVDGSLVRAARVSVYKAD